MPLFDAISSLFSHRAVSSSVTNPSVSAIGDNSSAIAVNGYRSGKRGGCDACNTIEIEEPSCGKPKQKKDDTWRIQLLEELRSLEENASISEKEHQQTKEFLLQQLEHYEKELLKVREHDVIVKEHRIPIPVHVPVHVPVRVPVVQRETRVISTSPCNSSLRPWRGPSTGGCSRSFRPVRTNSCNRCRSAGGVREAASIARLVNGATSPCAASRGGSCNRSGIDVNRYKSRLDALTASEQAISKRLSARRSVTSKVQRTLSKLTRAHEEEQRHLAKIADDKRKTVSRAFKELQERKEEEYRSHAERINAQLRSEQERLSEHMKKLQDWREAKMTEMRRLEESAAVALRSYDSSLRQQLSN